MRQNQQRYSQASETEETHASPRLPALPNVIYRIENEAENL